MMNIRAFTTGTLLAAALATASAQTAERVEYFFDSDPGYGQAATVSGVQTGDNDVQLSTEGLKPGAHMLCVRSQDSEGRWSTVINRMVYIRKASPENAVAIEYFLDSDPRTGNSPTVAAANGLNTTELDLEGASLGLHMLNLRAVDDRNNRSTVMTRPIFVCESRGISALEYFFDDNDPGEGNATQIDVKAYPRDEVAFNVPTAGLLPGEHQMNVRAKDLKGSWTTVSSEPFVIKKDETGISVVEMAFPLAMKAAGRTLTIERRDDTQRNDSRVEVFRADGQVLATASWPASTELFALPLNATTGTVMIVKVSDRQSGRTVVKRVIMN